MNVVDSSGWLEFFADEANADFFAPAIENVQDLVVPAISLYEVFKRVHQQRGEGEALRAVAHMMQGQVIELDAALAVHAAKLSIELTLPMADSIILATARAQEAILWTQDEHIKGIKSVQYVEKHKTHP
jgi:predicted nucleic acid-binding protein